MYTRRIVHVPALGKNAELRAALEARNASGNALAPHALSVLMFSPQPAFIHSVRHENLAAIEAYQERQRSDPTVEAQGGTITECLARPQAVLLYEELVATGVTGTPKFLMRTRVCPAPGKGHAVHQGSGPDAQVGPIADRVEVLERGVPAHRPAQVETEPSKTLGRGRFVAVGVNRQANLG